MAVLSGGGGSFRKLQQEPVGTVTVGRFVSFEQDVPSKDPRYKAQDILNLELEGEEEGESIKVGCGAALSRVFRANAKKLAPGTRLKITYNGTKKGKSPIPFHHFDVETLPDAGGDASFGFGANAAQTNGAAAPSDEEAALAARLEAARQRRAQATGGVQ